MSSFFTCRPANRSKRPGQPDEWLVIRPDEAGNDLMWAEAAQGWRLSPANVYSAYHEHNSICRVQGHLWNSTRDPLPRHHPAPPGEEATKPSSVACLAFCLTDQTSGHMQRDGPHKLCWVQQRVWGSIHLRFMDPLFHGSTRPTSLSPSNV